MNRLDKIAYNCKQATFLIEKKQIQSLTFREWLELNIHLAGCSVCRTFQRQSKLINRWVQEIFRAAQQTERHLDETFKEELQERIEEELRK
jgi:hypothetical protein